MIGRAVVVLVLLAGGARADDPLAQAILRRLEAAPSRAAGFVEQKQLASLTVPLTSRGRLEFTRADAGRPARLEQLTETPRPERVVIEGDSVTLQAGGQPSRTLRLAEVPELRALADALRATLAGDLPTLTRLFTIEASGSPAAWRLMLVPSDPALGGRLARVTLDGSDADVHQVTIQGAGETDVLTLTPLR